MSKIAIDAGHGKNTPGKRTLKSLDKNETREWVMNSRVASALEIYLKGAGHETMRVDDVSGNTDVDIVDRVKKANGWKADYYISIHHNAGINGGTGGGTVVYVYPEVSEITRRAQGKIYEYAVKRADLKGNRYAGTATADFYVLRETTMPATLIECGFMDSSTDIKFILDNEWSKKIALGIAEGICAIYGGAIDISQTESDDVKSAQSFNKLYAGRYEASADDLKLRAGAGTDFKVIASMPKGAKVQCYGYYTRENDGTIWLYVVYDGKVGFTAKNYLR